MKTIEPLEGRIAPATIFALDNNGSLVSFDSATPNEVEIIPITGLLVNQTLRGIDFRPATGELYAIAATTGSATNSIAYSYIINPLTGAATSVGQTGVPIPSFGDVPAGIDFNPTSDRIRVVNTNDENFRVNPTNGALAGDDPNLTPAATSDIIAEAYDRNFTGGTVTTLFGINRADNTLVRQGGIDGTPSPNNGVITTLGPLGISLSPANDGGFDIASDTGIAYAALSSTADNLTRLYTIDLVTGAATAVGLIGTGVTSMRSLAVSPPGVTIVNAQTATYVDADGDRVTIKVSKGALESANFALGAAAEGRGSLTGIFLGDSSFEGANLTLTVRKAAGGDGLAHVGFINAGGVDLGKVTIKGDLGRITAGDAVASTPGLLALNVNSFGTLGLITQGGRGSMLSFISGHLGSFKVAGDVGDSHMTAGSVGAVTVRGDFNGGIFTGGDIDSFRVGGDMVGINAERGYINCTHLGSAVIKGSVIGGQGILSGLIQTQSIGTVHIRGDLVAGSAFATGGISAFAFVTGEIARIDSVRVDGSVVGGEGFISGYIACETASPSIVVEGIGKVRIGGDVIGGDGSSGRVTSFGPVDQLTIRGSLIGRGTNSGFIFVTADVARLEIGRSVIGGSASSSGYITLTGGLGTVKIGGDLVGGGIEGSASVATSGVIESKGIGSLQIKGSIIAGTDTSTGTLTKSGAIISTDAIGSLKVGGIFGNATNPVYIVARGQSAVTGDFDIAIGSIAVKGDVEEARILAGFDVNLIPNNADASIGKVTVGGDWRSSSLVAGAQDGGSPGFGNVGDTVQPGGSPAIIARIASIAIKGSITGSLGAGDHFGFVAEQIDALKFGIRTLNLAAGPGNDNVLFPFTNDVRLLEV